MKSTLARYAPTSNFFREENVALETEVDLRTQEYQTTIGAMTVVFEGKERTLPEMGKILA